MLSVGTVNSAGGAASYYTQEDNYYFLGEASTQWFGNGALKLGLDGEVKKNDFKAVLEGNLQDGTSLAYIRNGENKHRAGYDLTFSAPKSVSVLALVSNDKEILEAHKSAVINTLKEIESMVTTRTMIDGVPLYTNTNSLIGALFMHDTNRNLDPQLHTHAIIANATFEQEKGWRTLSSDKSNEFSVGQGFIETVWNNQVALGAIYRQFLKEEVIKQGYEVENVGKNGLWEIKGVPTDIFSSRRQEILDAVGEDASNKALSVATKDTRKNKEFSNMDEVKKDWQKRLDETGFNKENIKTQEKISSEANKSANKSFSNVDKGDGIGLVEKALDEALKELSKNNIKFSYDHLLTKIINHIPARSGIVLDTKNAIENAIKKGELISTNKDETIFTTKQHLENEHTTGALISKLSEQQTNLNYVKQSHSIIGSHLLTNQSNFNLFSVRGKTDFENKLISDIQKIAEVQDKNHVVIVPDNKAKFSIIEQNHTLKENVFTIKEYTQQTENHIDKKGQFITLYRSEKMSLNDVKPILQKSYLNQDKVIALDTGGKRNTGLTRDIAVSMGIKEIHLNEKSDSQKLTIVSNIDKGDSINTTIKIYSSFAALNKNVIIQAKDNNLKDKLTQEIREQLKKNNSLSDRNISISSKQSIYLDANNAKDRRTYKIGYTLEKINNGQRESYTITGISDSQNKLTLLNNKGETSTLAINKINSDYELYRTTQLEIRVGEKVKSTGSFNDIKGGREFSIVGITKGNFLFKERIILQDEKGKNYSISTNNKDIKLAYNYVENLGASRHGKRENIIAVLSQADTRSQTINDIKRGGDNIIMLTSSSKDTIQKNIKLDNSQITITDSLKSLYKAENLSDIQRKAIHQSHSTVSKLIDTHIEQVTKETRDKVSFNGMKLIAKVTESTNITVKQVKQELESRIKKGELISTNGNNSLASNFITRENLENEKHILTHLAIGKGAEPPILENTSKINLDGLTKGQQNAAKMILTSEDRIMMIQGYAGVGKTTQFKTVSNIIQNNRPDIEIIGLTPTHKAKNELIHAGIKNANTVASFLKQNSSILNDSTRNEYKNKLFIIDESSMLGNRDLASLFDIIVSGGGRIILSGDHLQLKAFESGTPFKLGFDLSSVDKSIMDEIVRQKPSLKPAIESLIKGNIKDAFSVVEEHKPDLVDRRNAELAPNNSIIDVKNLENDERLKLIANDYVSRTKQAQDNTLIITPLNKDRAAINDIVHQQLKENGDLGQSITIPIYRHINSQKAEIQDPQFWRENVGNTAKIGNQYLLIKAVNISGDIQLQNDKGEIIQKFAQRLNYNNIAIYEEKQIEISENDKIRINATDRERIISNNDTGIVSRIDGDKIYLQIGDKEVLYNPINDKGDRHIDYGYSVTAYSSQGASIPNVIIYESENRTISAQDNTYVELSRSKEHIQIYVADKDKYISHISENTGERQTVHEILQRKESILARIEQSVWENSNNLSHARFADKLPENLGDIAHVIPGSSEIIFKVVNDVGTHRGNYHIPINPYRAEIKFDDGYYRGASDGNLIVLNQGDDQKPVKTYELTELDKAILNDSLEQTIVIKLDENIDTKKLVDDIVKPINESETEIDSLVKIHDELENKEISQYIDEIKLENNNKDIEKEKTNRLENEEINILHHKDENNIKQKEYGN
ncbi:MobF family relaxase [Pasteurella multocida]|uniref:MobF family relaxase n=1 Tax=Pasteurella multocida TaxID=747 RepID=UPI002FE15A82